MTLKATMIFSLTTNLSYPGSGQHRTGGWSESWYYPGTDINGLLKILIGRDFTRGLSLCGTRAALLPIGSSIVSVRIQQVDPVGPTQVQDVLFQGTSGRSTDIPQMALQLNAPGTGVRNVRHTTLRGFPDIWVTEGELNLLGDFTQAFGAFKGGLNGFAFRGRDLAAPQAKILTVDATGQVSTETPHGLNLLDMVRIFKSSDSSGTFRGGRFQVSTLGPGTNGLKVSNWPGTFGATTGGTIRKDAVIYPLVDWANVTFGLVTSRRVGRAPKQYRGRRSKRKK